MAAWQLQGTGIGPEDANEASSGRKAGRQLEACRKEDYGKKLMLHDPGKRGFVLRAMVCTEEKP
jgi:hypothetical protein